MMAKTRVVLNHAGFRELLTSAKVEADLRSRAERVASAAGEGYEVLHNASRRERAGFTVLPTTPEAIRSEAKNHNLLAALGAGAQGDYSVYTSKSGVTSLRSAAEIANYTRGRRG